MVKMTILYENICKYKKWNEDTKDIRDHMPVLRKNIDSS